MQILWEGEKTRTPNYSTSVQPEGKEKQIIIQKYKGSVILFFSKTTKLACCPLLDAGRRHKDSWIWDKRKITVPSNKTIQRISISVSAPETLNPHRDAKKAKESNVFIMQDSKHAWLLLQRKTLTLNFEIVHYTNIFEHLVWKTGQIVSMSHNVQKH